MKTLERIRCGRLIYSRDIETSEDATTKSDWRVEEFSSISAAKKANGLGGRKVEKKKDLPK